MLKSIIFSHIIWSTFSNTSNSSEQLSKVVMNSRVNFWGNDSCFIFQPNPKAPTLVLFYFCFFDEKKLFSVAVCGNCGGYSIDLAKCTGCRKPIKEGAKIMPDPDYKPPPGEHGPNKKGAAFAHQLGGDLRSIRLQPKPGRRKTNR